MGDMLTQAEIDALLKGSSPDGSEDSKTESESLTFQEIDALGEIGNISMGTSATTLFTLLGQRVTITTPNVKVTSWNELTTEYPLPYVAIKVEYIDGLLGSNFLILKEMDAKIITDLMMGGDGTVDEGELTEFHLSAISEAMNQMIGSSATSMSSMFDKRISISPPKSFKVNSDSIEQNIYEIMSSQTIVMIAFKMVVGNVIDSEIMQIIPIEFAKGMVEALYNKSIKINDIEDEQLTQNMESAHNTQSTKDVISNQNIQNYQSDQNNQNSQNNRSIQSSQSSQSARNLMNEAAQQSISNTDEKMDQNESIHIQPVQFQAFDNEQVQAEKKNIDIIMDVPLQVTVELGRTQKIIKEVLDLGPGSIIELDKLAGEPVDILINGKQIAKGEVVVIDESFGVRITDIIHPSMRLK